MATRDRRRAAVPTWAAPPLVAVAYVVASRVAAGLGGGVGAVAGPVDRLLPGAAAGLVAGICLCPLARRLPVPATGRSVLLFLPAWVLLAVSNVVESVLYLAPGTAVRVPLTGAVTAAGLALALTAVAPPPAVTTTAPAALRDALAARPAWGWLWRLVLLAAAWVPVYLVFVVADGALFLSAHLAATGRTPFAQPALGTIVAGQLVRGALHTLVLFPVAAALRGRRRSLALWLPLTVATLNAWVPLIQPVPGFDVATRIANLIEITGDALVFGLLAALLLGWPERAPAPD